MSSTETRFGAIADGLLREEAESFDADERERAKLSLGHMLRAARKESCTTIDLTASHLRQLVFDIGALHSQGRGPARDFALTAVLAKRSGNCLGISTVYVVLARALELDVQPILQEGHMLVRLAHSGERAFLETTRGGARLPERWLARLGLGHCSRELTDDELLVVQRMNRAAFLLASGGRLASALEQLDSCVHAMPDYVAAWVNRGTVLHRLGRNDDGDASLVRALALKPGPSYRRHVVRLLARSALATTSLDTEWMA